MFSALKTVSGNARVQEVWHFRHEQKIFGLKLKRIYRTFGKSSFGVVTNIRFGLTNIR